MKLTEIAKIAEGHKYSTESLLIHMTDPQGAGPLVPDIVTSSIFQSKDCEDLADSFASLVNADPEREKKIPRGAANIYPRLGTPLELMTGKALATLEGGDVGLMFADGMSAIRACTLFRAHKNAEFIIGVPVYGCTDNLFTGVFRNLGLKVHFVDLSQDPLKIKELFNRQTRVVYFETLANPSLRIVDIEALKEMLREENQSRNPEERITLIVDNTFATPYCCNPLKTGAPLEDMIVLHSTTKGLNGFASGLGGVAIVPWKYWKSLFLFRKDTGGTCSGFDLHSLLTKSIKTLALRVRKMQENAALLAQLLEEHPAVQETIYPGLPSFKQHDLAKKILRDWHGEFAPGHMISVVMTGQNDEEREKAGHLLINFLAEKSSIYISAVSLGYIGTLVEDPNSGTHSAMSAQERELKGIPRGLIRFSVGIEESKDLLVDMYKALEYVGLQMGRK